MKNEKTYDDIIRDMPFKNTISLEIDFMHILDFNNSLAHNIIINSEIYLMAAAISIKERLLVYDEEYVTIKENFKARIKNLPNTSKIPLREIRAINTNQLLQVSGIVTEMTSAQQLIKRAVFICSGCMGHNTIEQNDFDFIKPTICQSCERSRGVRFSLDIDMSEFVDFQKIQIQEKLEDLPSGQLPRTLMCIIKDDLVDYTKPGERINLIGIIKAKQIRNTTIYINYMEVNSIENLRSDIDDIIITSNELNTIKELSVDPNIYENIIESIAPTIYGLKEQKEAVMLSLFGGTFYRHSDPSKRRGEIHILIIGDPGLAKSVLLKSALNIAPRAIYTTGRGSSAAGLTAAVVHEKDSKSFTIKAGTFILADKGVAFIDEFEKMKPDDMLSIHEPMEQLTVSIAKAGINLTLNARASVIAAANPHHSRYNPFLTVAENIKVLKPTIFSRFDLIYVLRDIPKEDEDRNLSKFILNDNISHMSIINKNILRKYIYYARKNVTPILNDDAKGILEDFFIKVRDFGLIIKLDTDEYNNPVSITPRYLEALIRLTEAHAKVFLRDVAIKDDADAAISILAKSLAQVGIDPESGLLDIDRIETGRGTSRRGRLDRIIQAIRTIGQICSIDEIFENLNDIYTKKDSLKEDLELLYRENLLYKPDNNKYNILE